MDITNLTREQFIEARLAVASFLSSGIQSPEPDELFIAERLLNAGIIDLAELGDFGVTNDARARTTAIVDFVRALGKPKTALRIESQFGALGAGLTPVPPTHGLL